MNFSMYNRFNGALAERGAEATADYAVSMGFSSVEVLAFTDPARSEIPGSVEEAARLREVLASRGLTAACYSVATTLWKDDGTREAMLMEHARRAAAMGSPYLHHTLILWLSYPEGAPTYAEAMPVMLDTAARVAEYAKTLGVRCLYEPQGMYFNGRDGFIPFYRALRARTDNVGICADFGNPMFADDTVLPILTELGREVYHVHIKDYRRYVSEPAEDRATYRTRGGAYLQEVVIGQGDVDYKACIDALKAVGYSGAFALENSHKEPFEDGVRAGMALVKDLMETR